MNLLEVILQPSFETKKNRQTLIFVSRAFVSQSQISPNVDQRNAGFFEADDQLEPINVGIRIFPDTGIGAFRLQQTDLFIKMESIAR